MIRIIGSKLVNYQHCAGPFKPSNAEGVPALVFTLCYWIVIPFIPVILLLNNPIILVFHLIISKNDNT